jgi:hypothetical protein
MSDHIGEDAALYALGCLSESERAMVEAHAAHCHACTQLLAQASDDVCAIASVGPQVPAPADLRERIRLIATPAVTPLRRRRLSSFVPAVAAVLILALIPSVYLWDQTRVMRATMLAQSSALMRITLAAHRTAAFVPMGDAKVMYAPDGSWYFIVMIGVRAPVQVLWKHGGQTTMLGTATPQGGVATLYLPQSHRMDQLVLMRGTRELAHAQLKFDRYG